MECLWKTLSISLAVSPCVCGFLGSASDKESTCQCRRRKRPGFDPWVRKIPWRRKWQPTLVFLPGESHGQRSLMGYSPRGCKDSDTTECAHTPMCEHSSPTRKTSLPWFRYSSAELWSREEASSREMVKVIWGRILKHVNFWRVVIVSG